MILTNTNIFLLMFICLKYILLQLGRCNEELVFEIGARGLPFRFCIHAKVLYNDFVGIGYCFGY